ncbi:hypothetical protein EXIGLDRAFT_758896 [Exidia glandulosa HHB12029]|uniref:Mid2 domain-containing protein n=1 Tax=Exidia glandulosa HHB12029 TaxID=1314781 RepID=A0A166BRX4_EXIGL|nr:hypothetical protein EXIGLDRAFT_758896 [Exidia glandulosa HHB12029]
MRLAVRQTGSTSFTGSATSTGTTATPPPSGAEPTTSLPAGVSPSQALPPWSFLGSDTVGPVNSDAVATNPGSLVSPGPTTTTTTTTTSSTPSSSTPSSYASTSTDPSATPSSGSSGAIEVQGPVQAIRMGPVLRGVIIAVVGLLLLLVALFFCRRRIRRRRRVPEFEENLKAAFESRPTSPDESTVFPVHFSDPASSSTLLVSPVTPQQLRDDKALAILAAHQSKDKLTLDTAVSSAIGPSTSVSIVGSSEVERQFQASLEARAQRMGLTPRQLLMLLTTSLDNQHVMSDVASSDGASERAFSLVSVPPPAYDSAAAALARQTSTTR